MTQFVVIQHIRRQRYDAALEFLYETDRVDTQLNQSVQQYDCHLSIVNYWNGRAELELRRSDSKKFF